MNTKEVLALTCLNEAVTELGLYVGILNDKRVAKAFDGFCQSLVNYDMNDKANQKMLESMEE